MNTNSKIESKEKLDVHPHFVYAKIQDIGKVIKWDEDARIASTGIGYEDKERVERTEFFAQAIEDKDLDVILIRDSLERDVGFALCSPVPEVLKDQKTVKDPSVPIPEDIEEAMYLRSIALDSSVRGKGLGTRSLRELEKRYKTRGRKYLACHTGSSNERMQALLKDYNLAYMEPLGAYNGSENEIFAWKEL